MTNPSEGSSPGRNIMPSGTREKRLPSDPEAFQKKLDKVGEADPEQKKKRRAREEEAEETKVKMAEAQRLAKSKDVIAPFEIAKKLTAQGSLATGSPTAPKGDDVITPSLSDGADSETLFWEEDEGVISEEFQKAQKEATVRATLSTKEKAQEASAKEITGLEMEKGDAKKKESAAEEATAMQLSTLSAATAQSMSGIAAPPPATELQAYSRLSPQVLALFERMAGVMVVMTSSGMTETTISLTSNQFSSSKFFGAEITIREYSTAPKQFNVEVRGNPEAVALFEANIPYIEQSFRTGNYNFGIHRLETSISRIEEEPVSDKDKEREGQE